MSSKKRKHNSTIEKVPVIKHKDEVDLCANRGRCVELCGGEENFCAVRDLTKIEAVYGPDEAIYQENDPVTALYIVQSGAVKTVMATDCDDSHVSGFYFTAEMLGLESLGLESYRYNAIALVETVVCKLSIGKLTKKGRTALALQHRINQLVGQKLRDIDRHLYRTRRLTTEQRLVDFLQTVCEKYSASVDLDVKGIELPMTKFDIANYLGMAPESLSRALQSLEKQGVITNLPNRKLIEINTKKFASIAMQLSA